MYHHSLSKIMIFHQNGWEMMRNEWKWINMIQHDSKLLIIIDNYCTYCKNCMQASLGLTLKHWKPRVGKHEVLAKLLPATRLKGMAPEGCRASNHPALSWGPPLKAQIHGQDVNCQRQLQVESPHHLSAGIHGSSPGFSCQPYSPLHAWFCHTFSCIGAKAPNIRGWESKVPCSAALATFSCAICWSSTCFAEINAANLAHKEAMRAGTVATLMRQAGITVVAMKAINRELLQNGWTSPSLKIIHDVFTEWVWMGIKWYQWIIMDNDG